MQQVTNQQKLKPWNGFVLFAVVMVMFIFVGAQMQTAWRIYGLIATEAMFLVIAILYAVVFRIPLKEMFPVKKFKARDFFGSLFLAGGGILIGLVSVALVGMLIPSSLDAGDVQAITEFNSGSTGYLLTIFAMAVTPAICEEAIHRGAIITNFRTIKKDWIIVLIMGLFFGIFHLSVLRFVNTAIMGACLSYIVVKKNNILLSSLMHFLVNFVSTSLSYGANANNGSSAGVQFTAETMKVALGTYLIIGFAAPFFIVIGLMLLNPESHKKIRFLFAAIASVIMLIGGFAVTLSNSMGQNVLVNCNLSYRVEVENTEEPIEFGVPENGTHTVAVVIANAEGNYSVRIEKTSGEVILYEQISSGAIKMFSKQIELEQGDYRLVIINGEGSQGDKPTISVQIN